MILIRDLTKRYSSTVAANHVNLAVLPGEITVLLGPNGAGKSTTIKSIAGLLKHEGTITICGQPSKSMEARQILGYIPETPGLYDLLTVQEHVEFIRRAYCLGEDTLKRAQDLMVRFELDDKKDKMGKELSKGMGQKVSLLLGLMIQPKAVVVDEPMVGLDPKAIEELSALFVELKQAGVAVLISTHIIDMMESLWDRAYIMDKGCIAACAVREGNAAVPADVTADAVGFVSSMAFQEIAGDHLKPMFFQITGGGPTMGHNGAALNYLTRRKMANWLKNLVRKPLVLILTIFMLLVLVGMPVLGMMGNAQVVSMPWISTLAAIVVIYQYFILVNVMTNEAGMGLFRLADVNLAFVAPVSSKQLLLRAMMGSMVSGVLIALITVSYMALLFGYLMTASRFIIMELVMLFMAACMLSVNSWAYLVNARRSGFKRIYKRIAFGLLLFVVAAFLVVYLVQGQNVETAARMVSSSSWFHVVPVIGWAEWGIQSALEGHFVQALVALGLLGGSTFLVMWAVMRMKVDYYEYAQADADRMESVVERGRTGGQAANLYMGVKGKKIKMDFRQGAGALFSRQLLERRKAGVRAISVQVLYLIYVGMFYLLKYDFSLTISIMCFATMVTSLSDTWPLEFRKPYIYLIPAPSIQKAFYTSLVPLASNLISGGLAYIIALALYRPDVGSAIGYFLLFVSYMALMLYTSIWSYRILGSFASAPMQMFLRIIALIVASIPSVVLLIVLGTVAANPVVQLLVSAFANFLLSALFLFLSRRLFEQSELMT